MDSAGEMEQLINISDAPPSGNQDNGQYGSINSPSEDSMSSAVSKLVSFSRLATIFYGLLAIITVALTVLGIISIFDSIIAISIILGLNVIGSLCGAYGIFKFGTVDTQINKLKKENSSYKDEIDELNSSIDNLGKTNNEIQSNVMELECDQNELNEHLKVFADLNDALSQISGQNEDVLRSIDSINDIYKNMKDIIYENEKSSLISMYYDAEMKDKSQGMSESEYHRFLGRLSARLRDKFIAYGSFDKIAGTDGKIDLKEFQALVQEVLENNFELDMQQYIK